MLWTALRLCAAWPPARPEPSALQGLCLWALQFTPRVAPCEEAVLMEVSASLRLFGGLRALRARVLAEAPELGMASLAWAPTGLGALALARAGHENGLRHSLPEALDALPLHALSAVARHHDTLGQMGCRNLGDVRALPRGGLQRRFDSGLLEALDVAYGLRPEAYDWAALPETFSARLELPSRVDMAPALLFGARRLLLQMCAWLAARQQGVSAFELAWLHDSLRGRDVPAEGALTVRLAEPGRQLEPLCRLLSEHLAHVQLPAPVGELRLAVLQAQPLAGQSLSLLPQESPVSEALPQVLERLSARLGAQRVCRPVLLDDPRSEAMQRWQPAGLPLPRQQAAPPRLPQPSWLLPQPLPLAVRGHRPLYQGPLQLLLGPHRLECGWWASAPAAPPVQRDYWVALSEHAGMLWVFQQRPPGEGSGWFLQGIFA
jgi:protein ImuB